MMIRIITTVTAICFSSLVFAASDDPQLQDRWDCITCHGVDGRGNESVKAPRLAGMEPWYLKSQLENFRVGIRGINSSDIDGAAMQAVAASLSDDDIDEIIEWVSSLGFRSPFITIEGDMAAGLQLYQGCTSCHGFDGMGNAELGAPALAGQNDWYLANQLRNFKSGIRGADSRDSNGQQMALMARTLADEQQIVDVVTYINTFYGGPQ